MRKILAYITLEEKRQVISLNALQSTYRTLLEIDTYSLNKEKIMCDLRECNKKIDDFWFNITNKYNIPLYVDKNLRVDRDENCICIDE